MGPISAYSSQVVGLVILWPGFALYVSRNNFVLLDVDSANGRLSVDGKRRRTGKKQFYLSQAFCPASGSGCPSS